MIDLSAADMPDTKFMVIGVPPHTIYYLYTHYI